ncbi:MAG: PIG-L family deacetylase, partial [Planctomycetota bacterium]|nr:PIG-L family deacetylase [Planctomycetota bacterium]
MRGSAYLGAPAAYLGAPAASMRRLRRPLILLVLLCAFPLHAQWEPEPVDTGVVGLGLALRRLQTTASLLYITAHPDDEDNGLLAKLSRGKGLRVGTLTLTRGEGGQNEIGPELSDALGVLRSEELLATHRLDGVEQYFGSVVDFGYSFSVEETIQKWGQGETVRDIVRVLRRFRPDIVVTLSPGGAGGGQHHQASARLATEAFRAAGDLSRYPEMRSENPAWAARKLYRAHWSLSPEGRRTAIEVQLGDYDHLLGMSYAELGALARNRHRCQGMNRPPVPGPQSRWYTPVMAADGTALTDDTELLRGIPSLAESLSFVASLPGEPRGGEPALARLARRCLRTYDSGSYADLPALVMRGLAEVRRLETLVRVSELEPSVRQQASFLLGEEKRDWLDAAAKAHYLDYDAQVGRGHADGLVTPGEVFVAETRLVNRGKLPVRVKETRVEAPAGWKVKLLDSSRFLQSGRLVGPFLPLRPG